MTDAEILARIRQINEEVVSLNTTDAEHRKISMDCWIAVEKLKGERNRLMVELLGINGIEVISTTPLDGSKE